MYKLLKRIEEISSRERLLFFLTIISLLYYAWDNFVAANLVVLNQHLEQENNIISKALPSLQKQVAEMSGSATNNKNIDLLSRVQKLKEENIDLEQKIVGATKQLIPADKMAEVLRDIISAEKGLKIIKIENIPEEQIRIEDSEDNKDSKNNSKGSMQVYRHGLVVEFKSTYFATQKFLQAIEALPWKIVLGELNYQVTGYPLANVKVVLYTLSLQKEWLDM